jgi:uncharacterized protein with FMN-binding domain
MQTRQSISALIAATAVLGIPAANAWGVAAATPTSKAAAKKAAAQKTAAAQKKAAAAAAAKKKRTISGPTVDMRWGPVTVTIVLKGNKIVEVTSDLPLEKPRSEYINSRVGPYLRSQVLQTQSAQVDIISGATMTSEAYAESLQGALDKAGIKSSTSSTSSAGVGASA